MKREVYPPNVWRTRLITLAFILAVAAPAQQAMAYYKIIDLGTLGGQSSEARSINNHSQIVGYAQDSSGRYRATLFDATGGGNNIDLTDLPSAAYSINNHGQIVGYAQDSSGRYQATLFDPTGSGNNIDLGTLGGRYSWASSINDNGQIVGYIYYSSGYPRPASYYRATLFDPTGGGNNINLGTLDENWSFAYSINNNSQIVGRAGRAVLFDPTGRGWNINLGILPGGVGSVAKSINNCGQIVGSTIMGTEPFPTFPPPVLSTLFDPTGGGKNIGLGTLGGYESDAFSINDQGQIVGTAEDSLRNLRATLFDPTGGGNNIDLNTLIDPGLGWTLIDAYSINNNGWIVGYGINPAGLGRAYLLIPEPASAVIMVLGATLIASKRRL